MLRVGQTTNGEAKARKTASLVAIVPRIGIIFPILIGAVPSTPKEQRHLPQSGEWLGGRWLLGYRSWLAHWTVGSTHSARGP
jgi:hypothetical protein